MHLLNLTNTMMPVQILLTTTCPPVIPLICMILKRTRTKINRIEEVDEVTEATHVAVMDVAKERIEDVVEEGIEDVVLEEIEDVVEEWRGDVAEERIEDVVEEEIEDVAIYATPVHHHHKIHNGIQPRKCTTILVLMTETYDIRTSKVTTEVVIRGHIMVVVVVVSNMIIIMSLHAPILMIDNGTEVTVKNSTMPKNITMNG